MGSQIVGQRVVEEGVLRPVVDHEGALRAQLAHHAEHVHVALSARLKNQTHKVAFISPHRRKHKKKEVRKKSTAAGT